MCVALLLTGQQICRLFNITNAVVATANGFISAPANCKSSTRKLNYGPNIICMLYIKAPLNMT